MSFQTDRFSRLTALRPAAPRAAPPAGGMERQAELLRLLRADLRHNHCGQHVAVRKRCAEPGVPRVDPRVLRLLLPGARDGWADAKSWLFLDTETTGLAGGTGTYAFMVGLAWWEDDGLAVEQLLMQDFTEESSLLAAVAERLGEDKLLVTYNGKSFDWPLLETRYRMKRISLPQAPGAHLDLLHPARQIWRHSLRSVALAELEREVLKIERDNDIPSSIIPGLYFSFLRGGPPASLVPVFEHNRMDLQGLAMLAGRMAEMLEDPQSAGCSAAELFGISSVLKRRGDPQAAGETCRQALLRGLPEAAERAARRELALSARRERDFGLANEQWQRLLRDPQEGLLACEQLAIHYEHRERDLGRAASLVRGALGELREGFRSGRIDRAVYFGCHARLNHRLNRLLRKLGNPDGADS